MTVKNNRTIYAIVTEHAETLRAMTSHDDLRAFGHAHGFDNPQAFGRYKKALEMIGVSYQALRDKQYCVPGNIDPEGYFIRLAVAFDARTFHYAVTTDAGTVLWHGRVMEMNPPPTPLQGITDATRKGVWLASKAREASDLDGVGLDLVTDPSFTDNTNGGTARLASIDEYGRSLRVAVTIRAVPLDRNVAAPATRLPGWRRWGDNDLRSLIQPIALVQSLQPS